MQLLLKKEDLYEQISMDSDKWGLIFLDNTVVSYCNNVDILW